MILGNIMAVPEDVREAAMLDGASGLKQDWYYHHPYDQGYASYGIYPFRQQRASCFIMRFIS